jgi:hypothetical protein
MGTRQIGLADMQQLDSFANSVSTMVIFGFIVATAWWTHSEVTDRSKFTALSEPGTIYGLFHINPPPLHNAKP